MTWHGSDMAMRPMPDVPSAKLENNPVNNAPSLLIGLPAPHRMCMTVPHKLVNLANPKLNRGDGFPQRTKKMARDNFAGPASAAHSVILEPLGYTLNRLQLDARLKLTARVEHW